MLSNFIGDVELKSVMSDGYNAYVFIGDELKTAKESPNLRKTVHQVCMAHLLAKFEKAREQAGDTNADVFLDGIHYFYNRERQYDKDRLTPEERGKQRQNLESKSRLITLRQHLKIELDKDPSKTTPYLRAALNYLDTFWDNLFAFLKDGSLPIDHSIISTVKMQGRSAWEYLGKFFTKIFNGCRDFFTLRPDQIGLAICQ